ncbi:predicted GPI-anchored protein 58 isoform X1 [Miscanthus floridulus]|uniref:predicted GPI-anchored protein 58 isoform X1 n=1 Tax=Miscanthus floridulus TaxID=154761 RepID=UPI0034580FA9
MAIKMDKTSIIVCSVIGSLGLLSAILGFSAEGTKLTPYTILVYGDDCLYPQNPAIGLGICAAIFLIVAQVTFSAVGGCCGCCRSRSIPSETRRIVGIVCAVFSWIAAVIAFALFIEGAAWNANVVRVAEAPYCPYLKDGVFAGAGVLALAATALSITSFIMQRTQPAAVDAAAAPAPATSSAAGTPNRPGAAGGQSPSPEVVMGHPLLPSAKPQTDYPVKPQGYEQPQVPHPQGYAQAPPQTQNLQSPPPAAQDNVSHAPNHQLPPRPAPAAAPAVVVAAAAASEPSVLQVPLQYSVPIPAVAPQFGGVDIPGGGLPSAALPAAGSGPSALSTVIRNEVARQGVKLAAHVVTQSLFSDNSTVGDGILSMMTGSAGGDAVQATN